MGWDENKNQSTDNVTYAPGATYSTNAPAKLYAIWKPKEYKVTFNLNAGSDIVTNIPTPNPMTKIADVGLDLPFAPLRGDYTLLGWATSASATSVNYSANNGIYTSNSDATLYAIWCHEITYDANGGTGAPNSQNKIEKTNLQLSTTKPSKDGFTFGGYSLGATDKNVVYQPGDTYTNEADLNLFAVYGETITLDPNGGELGSVPSEVAKISGVTLTLPYEIPTKEGYAFLGWNEDSTATTATYGVGDSYTKEGANTLYAIWGTNYTVTYNSNGYEFGDTTTSNIVSYSSTPEDGATKEAITIYSHTANIDDSGTATGTYAASLNTNEVITIPGANSLHIKLYYSLESISCDWVCVWAGNHPDYNAYSSTHQNQSSFAGTTGRIGGGAKKTMAEANVLEGDIDGDTVTFGFRSDGSSQYYGYYAVVTGERYSTDVYRLSGVYKEPEIPNGYKFLGWSTNPNAVVPMYTSENEIVSFKPADMTLYAVVRELKAMYLNGQQFNSKIKTLAKGSSRDYDSTDSLIKSIEYRSVDFDINDVPVSAVNVAITNDEYDTPIYAWFEKDTIANNGTGTLNIYSEANRIWMNNDASCMFRRLEAIQSLEPINDLGITELTNNVTNMSNMFSACGSTAMTLLYLGDKFDTSKVVNMSSMFSACGKDSLTSLNLGNNFDTTSVNNMREMFHSCGYKAMTSLNLGDKFDTSNVTDMKHMFYECGYKAMTSLNLGNKFDTSNVTDMNSMFDSCGYLAMTSLNLGDKFDTRNVIDMSHMFYQCGATAMTYLDLGDKFDTCNVTKMDRMFMVCGSNAMISLNLGNKFDTSNVTDMSYMFFQCGATAMTYLDLGDKFDTSNVTNMDSMFMACGSNAMISINLGNKFDTSNVTNMTYMFYNCGYTAMTSLDLGNKFDTSNVTNMSNMFNSCGFTAMTSLDLGDKFNTSNVTNMSRMFNNCGYNAMTSLSLGDKFDASSVTNMSYMFANCGRTNMTSLNLGNNFDTSSVTNMNSMFASCGYTAMTSLDLGNKFDTSKVTDMTEMFNSCGYTAMTSLNLGNKFDTSNVTSMHYMFGSCGKTSMTSLSLGDKIDTSNVLNMCGMFYHMDELTSIDLTNFDTSNVTNMSNMFMDCGKLVTIYVSPSFNTSIVSNSNDMFTRCISLVGGAGTTFKSSYVDKTYSRIDGGPTNPGYFTLRTD